MNNRKKRQYTHGNTIGEAIGEDVVLPIRNCYWQAQFFAFGERFAVSLCNRTERLSLAERVSYSHTPSQ